MDTFMKAMGWMIDRKVHAIALLVGLVLFWIGLLRAFKGRYKEIGQSAMSAVWMLTLVVLLMCVAPVVTTAGWLAQSIPFIGDMMDYGSIIGLIENNPWRALVNFVDCYILAVMTELLSKLFFGGANTIYRKATGWADEDLRTRVKSVITKILLDMIFMFVCILLLERFKQWEKYKMMEKFIYGLSGSVLIFGVLGLIATVLFGGGVLPPIMMLIPNVLVKPLFVTTYYVMILAVLDIGGVNLRGIAQNFVEIAGAFAPAVIVIIMLIIAIVRMFRI